MSAVHAAHRALDLAMDEAAAEALDDALAAVETIADTGGADSLTWDDAIAAIADALADLQ